MSHERFVIVGAGHGGVQLAFSLRTHGWRGEILLICAEAEPPYQKPPLSKLLSPSNPRSVYRPLVSVSRYQSAEIQLKSNTRAVEVDAHEQRLLTAAGESIAYDRLAICTGSKPATVPAPIEPPAHVHYVGDLSGALKLSQASATHSSMIVIGGGPLALETAACLAKAGLRVTVLERNPRLMQRYCSAPISEMLIATHRAHGVDVITQTSVAHIASMGNQTAVTTEAGATLRADIVFAAIGTQPNIDLLAPRCATSSAGVTVDACCRTAIPNVYALGDCASYPFDGGAPLRIESLQAVKIQVENLVAHLLQTPLPTPERFLFCTSQFDVRYYRWGSITPHDRVEHLHPGATNKAGRRYYLDGEIVGAESINDLSLIKACQLAAHT